LSDTRRFIRYVKTNCRGQENAQHGDEIAKELGLFDRYGKPKPRALRVLMEKANDAGELIGATPDIGYWWVVDSDDAEEAIKHNYNYGHKHLKNARKLEKAVLKAYGPPQLFPEKVNA